MAKNPVQSVVDETATAPSLAPLTKWETFEKAHLNPKEIICEGYGQYHLVNSGCHTRLPLTAESMIAHLQNEHGGGFIVKLAPTDGKSWAGWQELKAAGIEMVDFRCQVCSQEVPLNPQHILKHFRAHSGNFRKPLPGGTFLLTISTERPMESEGDAFIE